MNPKEILEGAIQNALDVIAQEAYNKGYEDGKRVADKKIDYSSILAFLQPYFGLGCENLPPGKLRDKLLKAWINMRNKTEEQLEEEFKLQLVQEELHRKALEEKVSAEKEHYYRD